MKEISVFIILVAITLTSKNQTILRHVHGSETLDGVDFNWKEF
jgi:hypothetical protein